MATPTTTKTYSLAALAQCDITAVLTNGQPTTGTTAQGMGQKYIQPGLAVGLENTTSNHGAVSAGWLNMVNPMTSTPQMHVRGLHTPRAAAHDIQP